MSSFMERLLGKQRSGQALSERPRGLTIRKLADYSDGRTRVAGYHPVTGEKTLINAETNQVDPYPLLGVMLEDAPQSVVLPNTTVDRAISEGWATGDDEKIVHRPGGPPDNPWALTHTFRQFSAVTFHTVEGDVRYRIVHNPDKYDDDREASGKRVDWFYLGEKENVDG